MEGPKSLIFIKKKKKNYFIPFVKSTMLSTKITYLLNEERMGRANTPIHYLRLKTQNGAEQTTSAEIAAVSTH